MATPHTALAQRSREKLYFDHPDMDYYLAWIMGREIYGGSDADKCLATAAEIASRWNSGDDL